MPLLFYARLLRHISCRYDISLFSRCLRCYFMLMLIISMRWRWYYYADYFDILRWCFRDAIFMFSSCLMHLPLRFSWCFHCFIMMPRYFHYYSAYDDAIFRLFHALFHWYIYYLPLIDYFDELSLHWCRYWCKIHIIISSLFSYYFHWYAAGYFSMTRYLDAVSFCFFMMPLFILFIDTLLFSLSPLPFDIDEILLRAAFLHYFHFLLPRLSFSLLLHAVISDCFRHALFIIISSFFATPFHYYAFHADAAVPHYFFSLRPISSFSSPLSLFTLIFVNTIAVIS